MDETTEPTRPNAEADDRSATDQGAPSAEPAYAPVDTWEQIQAAEGHARREFFGLVE